MSLSDNISSKKTNKNASKQIKAAEQHVKKAVDRVHRPRQVNMPRPYYNAATGFAAAARPFFQDTWKTDGLSHFNISPDARTDLGAALSMDYEATFEVQGLGMFGSLTAFHYFITRPVIDDSIRYMKPREIRSYVRQMREAGEKVVNPTNYRYLLLNAQLLRIQQLRGLHDMVLKSSLRFENYCPPSKNASSYRLPAAHWFIPGMEIIRDIIKHKGDLFDFLVDPEVNDIEALLDRPVFEAPKRSSQSVLDKLVQGDPKPKKQRVKKPKADAPTPGPAQKTRTTIEDTRLDLEVELNYVLFEACLYFPDKQSAMAYILDPSHSKIENGMVTPPNGAIRFLNDIVEKPELTFNEFPVMVNVHKTPSGNAVFRLGLFDGNNPFVKEPGYNGIVKVESTEEADPYKLIPELIGLNESNAPVRLIRNIPHEPIAERIKLIDHTNQPLEVSPEDLQRGQNLADQA